MSLEALITPAYTVDDTDSEEEKTKRLALRRRNVSTSPWMTIAREEFEHAPSQMFNASSSGTILIRFNSPAANRLQLRAQSCDIWFPQKLEAGLGPAFSLTAAAAPRCPALAVALDSSCLVHLGQEDGDMRLLRAGQELYCDSLMLLRAGLQAPLDQQSDALIAAINVLQVIEAFTSMVFKGDDRGVHTQGIKTIMSTLQPQVQDGSESGLSQLLDSNFRVFFFWDALIRRKHIEHFFLEDATALMKIAQSVPGALEECDEACKAGAQLSLGKAADVMSTLLSIESKLNAWKANWSRCLRDAPYSLVSSLEYPYPEPKAKMPSKAFPLVFQFQGLEGVLDHVVFSACLFSVKRAMLDFGSVLLARQSGPAATAICGSSQALVRTVTNCTDTICMSLPYLCRPEHNRFGYVVSAGPLHFVNSWYRHLRKRGNVQVSERVLWCFEATKRMKENGIRPL